MRRRSAYLRSRKEEEKDSGSSSHFAIDREVELRLLNPSNSSSGHSGAPVWVQPSQARRSPDENVSPSAPQPRVIPKTSAKEPPPLPKESIIPSSNYNKVVTKKKIVSPSKSIRKKEFTLTKKRIHIPNSPRGVSPKRKPRVAKAKPPSPPPADPPSQSLAKPWRTNMKSSLEIKEPSLPEENCPNKVNRRSGRNLEEVKEYMRKKSNQQREESLREKHKSLLRKEAIRNRLEDLEHRRKEKVVHSSPKAKNFCPIHGYNNVDMKESSVKEPLNSQKANSSIPKRSTMETLKEVQRNKLDNQLFFKLEELTRELDQKKRNCQLHSTQKSLAKTPSEAPRQISPKDINESMEVAPNTENNKREKHLIQCKQTVDRTTSPIQSLISKHQKDIDFVKKMDSNLLPSTLKSDNFNFISTVKRKMNIEAARSTISSYSVVPQPDEKVIISKTEDTLSEGPISTSLASFTKPSSSYSAKGSIKELSSSKGTSSRAEEEEEESPSPPSKPNLDRSNKSAASKLSYNSISETLSKSKGCTEFVPSALHLRFLAELNQLENVQSTEKHIDKLDRIRDITVVRQDAATMASIIKGLNESKSGIKGKSNNISKKESRAEFENRIRKEFNDLFQGTIQPLIQSQTEATRVTADATKMLASLHKNFLEAELRNRSVNAEKSLEEPVGPSKSSKSITKTAENAPLPFNPSVEMPTTTTTSEVSRPSVNTIHEEVISLISKTESSIPEILSVLEKASRSGDSIRQTISEVMSRKNEEDSPSSCSSVTLNTNNITEEIENEVFSPQNPPSSTPTRLNSATDVQQSGDSSEFTLNMIEQHIQVESSRASNQYLRLKLKEKKIVERAKSEMGQLDAEKKALKSNNQDTSHISRRQKIIVTTVQSQRREIKALKEKLKAAERERQAVLRRQRAFLKDRRRMNHDLDADSVSLTYDTSQTTPVHEDLTVSKALNIPDDASPSPKVTRKVSESSEESMMNLSQSSDHSDAAIRINALKDELQKQKSMAKKLREQQKIKKQESLKAQTESLKKQIETYDKLILRTRDEINHQESSFEVVPPQIKTPVSKSRSLSESEIKTNLDDGDSLEQDIFSNKTSISETIGTEIPSQESRSPPLSSPPSSSYSSSKASTVIPETQNIEVKKSKEQSIESVSSSLFNFLLRDSLREYGTLKKEALGPKSISPKNEASIKQSEVRVKGIARPQDLMLTTFDLDPNDIPSEQKLDTSTKSVSILDDDDGNEVNADNDFIDDDFGLSTIKKESEQLLQQQMLIEEEINRIQEESSGLEKPPPPPYTTKTSVLRRNPAITHIPPHLISSRSNLEVIVPRIVDYIQNNGNSIEGGDKDHLYEALLRALKEKSLYEEPTQFLEALHDTLVEFREDLTQKNTGHRAQNPPWMKQKSLPLLKKLLPQNEVDVLLKETLFLFGREKRNVKEALVLRSFKKKRSHVENLLAHELIREKEDEWSGYDAEETFIKDSLASTILKNLIKDTVVEIKRL